MLGACKKDDDSPKEEVCTKVSSYSASYYYSPNTHVNNISYDNQDRISKVAWSNSSLTYTYSANSITEDLDDSGYMEQTVYTLDSQNRIVRAVRGTELDVSYFYNAEGYLSELKDGSETKAFVWQNGNMVEGDGITYSYYNEAVPQSYLITAYGANSIYLNSYLYNYFGKISKNLIKTESIGQNTTNYQYEKDTQGRVTKITSINGGNKDTYAISYSCN